MILVTVLLFMALIMALVIHSQVLARMALRFEDRQFLRAQLRVAATEAAWDALLVLAADEDLQVDHTNEPWAVARSNCLPNLVTTLAVITDRSADFNINNLALIPSNASIRSSFAIVQDMLAAHNWPDPVGGAQALKDWIDSDSEGARESGYYHEARLAMVPPDAAMESPAELHGVLNAARMEPRAAPPGLAVFPNERGRIEPVNVNTASREVLQALLGVGRSSLVELICQRRAAYPLKDLGHVLDARTLASLRPYLDTRGRYFAVTAHARRSGQQENICALVRRDDQGEIEILRWIQR